MIDSHCHLDPQYFGADRAEVLARARGAGVAAFMCIGSAATWSAPRGGRAGGGRAGRLRHGRRAPARRRAMPRATGRSWKSWRAGPGWSASARPGSTTTTTTRRAELQQAAFRRFVALARATPAAGRLPHPRRPRGRGRDPARRASRPAGSSTASRAACRRARLPGPRPYLSFSGILTFKNAGRHPRGRGVRAARPHPGRDRRPLPGPHPPPRQERARLRGRDAGRAGRAARLTVDRGRRRHHRQRPPTFRCMPGSTASFTDDDADSDTS